jgi:hypothetical protein
MLPNLGRLLSSPFFQNKFVLYGSLVIVLLSILRYIANENINAVVLMALIGLIMSYFSKNMIIVLLTAFVTVFVFEMIGAPGVTEGMKTKEGKSNIKKDKTEGEDKEEESTGGGGSTGGGESTEGEKKDSEKKDSEKIKDGNTTLPTVKSKKDKQGMTKLSPANYNGNEKDDDNTDGTANRIDYASTLEQAYDNIENIIGEDGVRGLTDQTKSLMNQQKMLMQNMKEMGPLLKSAEGFMEQITGNGGIGGITEMLKGFATPGGNKEGANNMKKK